MKFFSRFFGSVFHKQSECTLVISIYEFPRPRDSGIFEIRLGKRIILEVDYDFNRSTIQEIKQKIDSKGVDLRVLQFDAIKFNNISQFGQKEIIAWMKKK
jgi:hypothetical protein